MDFYNSDFDLSKIWSVVTVRFMHFVQKKKKKHTVIPQTCASC